MSRQVANVIDFQAYREAREKTPTIAPSVGATWPAQAFLMWVPFVGFVPVVPFGNQTHGG
ncbi:MULTISPECIES: hypothetical protein [unclassified Rhizobium]|jgi:hypothetical protein|uniref:hypothetical protein n=1 Tax=unclassified Rhizobium TaxID=2613769 RepID=UPI000645C1C5|nr:MULTISPECIES: hypothetical protein [unclassified Rhizobium]OJY63793.1 MAG: hypothetical protein BGP09_00855 [Rhizobium sp. 60-20]RKD60783.1 hypothetical protein BJ928_10869 [Rhizobium sp. WW_1]